MEQLFDFAKEAMKEAMITPEKYQELQKAIAVLSEYYSGKEWKQDYADDEAGLLPKDLKRGVLSEDGLWNLLSDWQEAKTRIIIRRQSQLYGVRLHNRGTRKGRCLAKYPSSNGPW